MEISFGVAEGGRRGERFAGSALPAKIGLTLLIVATLGPLAATSAAAALRDTGPAHATRLAAGTVYITDDTGGQAMLSMRNGAPGSSATSYATIGYGGTLPASVRLYGRTSGTGLARFLTLTITRGMGAEGAFVPDPVDYAGAGPGVVYSGTLADLPGSYDAGVVDPGAWSRGDSHAFRFVVTLTDDARAMGLVADSNFRFEARNA